MKNVSGMHKAYAITNLAHEHHRCFFCQNKIIVDNSLEQLPTCNSKEDINQTDRIYINSGGRSISQIFILRVQVLLECK